MADAGASARQGAVAELKVTGHLMTLEPGVFCIFQNPTGLSPDRSGLPGVRLSLQPGVEPSEAGVEIGGFRGDGWIGEFNDAALVRVTRTAQILVTIYQSSDQGRAPNLQVMRIAEVPGARTATAPAKSAPMSRVSPEEAEMSAHIERTGDVLGRLGEWMGEPGSKRWIEGFALDPKGRVAAEDLEYQAVLGRGWLSPWVQGGEFCGSRGMALPILGLRVRLRGAAAETHDLKLQASFTDGSKVGPLNQDESAEAESLSPLEAFQVLLTERVAGKSVSPPGIGAAETSADRAKPAASKPAAKPASPARRPAKPVAKPAAKAKAKRR